MMKRRTFIKLAGATAAVLGGGGIFFSRRSCREESLPPKSASKPIGDLIGSHPGVIVGLAGLEPPATMERVKEAVRSAAETATDFSWLSKGDTIFIKPAMNSGNPYPATTSPKAVSAMIRLLKEKGAGRVIVGDMSGIEHVKLSPDTMKGSSRSLAVSCGIAGAVENARGELFFPEEAGWKAFYEEGPPGGSHWKAGVTMPKILKEVDHIVLMPRCSRHALAGASLGLKAAVGYWRTDSRLEYHRDAATLQEKTAEANFLPVLQEKQRLVLTMADKVLTTFGPDKGYIVTPETGLVFASSSVIAHDMVSLAFLLESRRGTPEVEKEGLDDPYTSQFVVKWANRMVTFMLGGLCEASKTQNLIRNDIKTIWDDRVLRRGFDLIGGIPNINLKEAGYNRIPASLVRRIVDGVTLYPSK
ncbi:MAG: DUF362 domain-containing protein [Deltaproteobacteria bacterium]|nr:DUF362 domain-containing protein [Deltaproteobacteria bacterium]